MKAIILVGGEGTRLRPLTCKTSKGMVPVLNHPFLEYMFLYLKQNGVSEIILAEGCYNRTINDYFADGKRLGVRLFYQVEPEPRGTAGAIKNAEKFVDGTFLVLNGDIHTDLDIRAMVEFHKKNNADLTVSVF